MARLQQHYRDNVVPGLQKSLGLANPMQVPKITKITVNMGVGEAVADKKAMPVPVSKVAIFNPASNPVRLLGGRVGFKTLTDGKKVRFFKSNGEMIDA